MNKDRPLGIMFAILLVPLWIGFAGLVELWTGFEFYKLLILFFIYKILNDMWMKSGQMIGIVSSKKKE